jgi:transposase InsO family protein
MGLTNAPATFQNLMNSTFREYLDKCVLVFLDDIVVYSKSLDDHERDVRAVLQRLKDAGLCAKESKCQLFMPEIEFLGHHVGRNGLRVMPDKVEAVRQWQVPTNATDLRSFLGLAGYYRRFVQGFSEIAAPLHALTQTKPGTPPYAWNEQAQTAFDALKRRLQEAPVLVLPNPDLPFVVHTDASDFATGAVLQQDHGAGLQPVAFLSHKMLPAERNYEVHDKEMLAIIKMLGEWRTYLQGRQPFTIKIKTDHNSLQYFMSKPELTGRQARWLEKLADFDFKIEYVKGVTNTVADALSRNPAWAKQVSAAATSVAGNQPALPAACFMELCGMRRSDGGWRRPRAPRRAAAKPAPVPDTPAEAAQREANRRAAEETLPPGADRPAPNAKGAIVMPSQRCTAQTKDGGHCRVRTAKGQYCYSHRRCLLGLRIGRSSIPGAGLGVIATKELPKKTRLLYAGDLVPVANASDGGAYYLELRSPPGTAVDAARTNAGDGRWVNDPKGTGKRANCKFVGQNGSAVVETTRRIAAGEELLASYGGGYWRYHAGDASAKELARKHARIGQPAKQIQKAVADNAHIAASSPPASASAPSSSLVVLIRAAARVDTEYQAALTAPDSHDYTSRDGLLFRGKQPVIPSDPALRTLLLSEAHDAASAGHTGVASTFDRLSTRVHWPRLREDVHAYVTSCDSCQRNKVEQRKTAGLLRPPPTPDEPGYAINMDFVTGLPRSRRGHTAYLSITCRLSNVLQVGLCEDTVTAAQAAQLVFDHWVVHYGLPATIISDRDPRFLGEFWQALWKIMGTQLSFSTAGHPQTDGKAENRQRTANTMLRHFVSFEQTDWDSQLLRAVFAINHTRSASTGLTPFEVMFGRIPRLPLDIALEPLREGDSANGRVPAAHDFAARFAPLWQHARENLQRAQADQKRHADKHRREVHYAVGDLVLLSVRDLKFTSPADLRRSAKFAARFVGPFAVKRIINDNAYELDLPPELRVHPTQNVSKLRRWTASPDRFAGRPQPHARPPPAVTDAAGNEEYDVERILAQRRTGRGGRVTEYLVKWVGYPNEDCSWVSKARLNCPELLAEFLSINGRRDDGP